MTFPHSMAVARGNRFAFGVAGPLCCLVDEVFVLWHVHDLGDGEEDSKLIGIYRSQDDAEAAKVRAGPQRPTSLSIHERPSSCCVKYWQTALSARSGRLESRPAAKIGCPTNEIVFLFP
jgi:hypothetical protein